MNDSASINPSDIATDAPAPPPPPPAAKPARKVGVSRFVMRLLRNVLPSPVYAKEMTQMATNWRLFAFKIVYLLLLLTITAAAFIGAHMNDMSMRSQLGSVMFYLLAYSMLVVNLLCTPIVTAGTISGEREANTIGLLFLTRLSTWNIVQDKGLSRISLMLWLNLLIMPFFFADLLFGGVDTAQIINLMGHLLGTVMLAGGLGLLYSTLTRRYTISLILTYVTLALFMVVMPILTYIVETSLDDFFDIPVSLYQYLAFYNPWFGILLASRADWLGTNTAAMYGWIGMIGVGGTVYLLSISLASLLLRRLVSSEPNRLEDDTPQRNVTIFAVLWGIVRWSMNLIRAFHPLGLLQRGKEIGDNPIAWKEADGLNDGLKFALFNTCCFLLAITFGLILLGSALNGSLIDQGEFYGAIYVALSFLFALFFALLSASSVSRERHGGTWLVLLTTRLKGRDYVLGHFRELIKNMLAMVLLLAPLLIIGNLTDPSDLNFLLPMFVTALHFTFLAALGLWISVISTTNFRAIGRMIGVIVVIYLIVPVLMMFAQSVFDWEQHTIGFMLAISPVLWDVMAVYPETLNGDGGWGQSEIIAALVLHLCLYSALTALIIYRLMSQFDRLVGRQSEGTH